MHKIILFILGISIYSSISAQEYKAIKIDSAAFELFDAIESDFTIDQIINKINELCTSDTQKLYLIAGWFYHNIDFDLAKFKTGGPIGDYQTIFKTRKGTCGDYTSLFAEFCNRLKITNEIVEGYVSELNKESNIYYETNHAWNIVKLGNNWWHCDILGASGYLKQNPFGYQHFVKTINFNNFLMNDMYFLSKHIPAMPMWQLSNYPIPMDSLLFNGFDAKIDSTQQWFNYEKAINEYTKFKGNEKLLKYADSAFEYNKNNYNVIVISYYNAAVDLVNNWNKDKNNLILAKQYLVKAKTFVPHAKNGAEILKEDIDYAIQMINKYL